MNTETSESLDRIARCINRAEALNMLHACRDGHPLGRDNLYKWRSALGAVRGSSYSERCEIENRDFLWLEQMAIDEGVSSEGVRE